MTENLHRQMWQFLAPAVKRGAGGRDLPYLSRWGKQERSEGKRGKSSQWETQRGGGIKEGRGKSVQPLSITEKYKKHIKRKTVMFNMSYEHVIPKATKIKN